MKLLAEAADDDEDDGRARGAHMLREESQNQASQQFSRFAAELFFLGM